MPMVIAFERASYSPASIISGHVILVRKSPISVRGLSLRWVGKCQSYEEHGKKEIYFDEKVDIFGHDGGTTQVKVGESLFPFSFLLPPGLPSSFLWPRGFILYFVEASLTPANWKEDKVARVRLNVEGIADLSLEPLSPHPINLTRSKYVSHFLHKSGPFLFNFQTGKSGFLRGSSIPFSMQIKNFSKVEIKSKISLVQEISPSSSYSSYSSSEGKRWRNIVAQLKGPSLKSNEEEVWSGALPLPAELTPTNLGNILNTPNPPLPIHLRYFVRIELRPKIGEALVAQAPVIVGTRDGWIRHDDACPMSSSTTTSARILGPSQFHPMLNSSHGVGGACAQCRSDNAIHRRLRRLQRRLRRESRKAKGPVLRLLSYYILPTAPPSYHEAVPELPNNDGGGDGAGENRENAGRNEGTSPQSDGEREALFEAKGSEQRSGGAEEKEGASGGESESDSAPPNHVVTITIGNQIASP